MPQGVQFRKQALQNYSQRDQPVVLPRFVSLRAAAFLWVLLALCVGAALASWLVQIPSYVSVSGVVQSRSGAGIVLFLPASEATEVHQHAPVQVQLGMNGPQFSATIATVKTGIISPAVARQRYSLGGDSWGVVTGPSIVLIVPLPTNFKLTSYAGSLVMAQVQVGMGPVLRLLPGLNA